jgi:FKBP-type peptidyl-prolyl cis-trans isomerase FkpA
MIKMRSIIALFAATVLLASCSQYEKTPSGMTYKITKGSSSKPLSHGQFVKFNIEYSIPPKDSVLSTSYGHIPAYMVIDTMRPAKHNFLEIITKVGVGDKVEFNLSVDTLKKLGMIEYNNVFRARDMIKGRVEILKTFANQQEAEADLAKEQEIEKQNELKDVVAYANKKGYKTQTTASGVVVNVVNAGDAVKADTGKVAKVMYKGYFTDGKQFDTNMDPKAPGQPMNVVIGTGGVIPGLEDGLKLFGKGGKGTIIVPAVLAYGGGGNPPVIPPYSTLVFDVEIVDVTAAPAQQPAPQMPPAPIKK